jgi:hypothetical protein
VREAILAEYQAKAETQDRVAELEQQLQQQVADKDAVIETLQQQLAAIRDREFEASLDGRVAELVSWNVKTDEAKARLAAFRRMVRQRIVAELNDARDNLDAAVETAWAEMKPLAETLRDALAGPAAIVAGKKSDGRDLEDTPEARAKARAVVGL